MIAIDSSQVTGGLRDFPVLINLSSDAQLAADAQDDGDDILFTASNGLAKLSHEIERFCGGIITAACPADTGELVAWVKVPYLPSQGSYARYAGDKSVPGKGEILVWNPDDNTRNSNVKDRV